MDAVAREFIPAKSCCEFSNLNSFYRLDCIDRPHTYPFVKLPSPIASLPPSFSLSSHSISTGLYTQFASSWWAYWQLHLSTLLSYWDLFATFPVLYWSFPCGSTFTSECVCVCVCFIGVILIDWLYCRSIFKFLLIVFFGSTFQDVEARKNVFIFVQKLSVLAVVIHGAVRLWSVGHQHQGAAARGAVEEALRTAISQVVPQVRVR